ncbi:extracellular solute-binding protein [Treponema lecithinolyticum]|uniref:extracellular solute-binding protein n=1 Tax=Treponema lecithinolyticum TaxID=53418 RepID=UPI0028EBA3F4|nr:extracellular solute-binding protein [Treponema lecithinolyticum]
MEKKIAVLIVLVTCAGLLFAAGGSESAKAGNSKQLSMHLVFNGIVFDENWDIYRYAAEKTGISLTGTASKNNTDSKQAFNLMIASGNLPDIISYTISDLELLGFKDGAVIDLSDLIEKHAPNIKRFMKEHPRLAKDMYAYNGKIYALPTYYDYDKLNVTTTIFIRTDWLKKFNLKVPSTIEEMEKVLTTIVNGDANGNGKKDEIGLFGRGTGTQTPLRNSMSMLGARSITSFYIDENGKIQHNVLEPSFKTAVETMASWYKKGLVDKEIFTRGWAARDQLLPTDLGTATFDWPASTSGYNYRNDTPAGFEFKAIPPLRDKNGKLITKSPKRNTSVSWAWGISATAKDPVAAIKYMDWWFSEEGRRTWNWGIEGKHYTMVNGKPQFTDYVLKNSENLTPLQVLHKAGAQVSGIGVHQDAEYEFATAANAVALEAWKIYMENNGTVSEIPILKFSPEEQAEIAKIKPAIDQTTSEYIQKWILGASDINAEWDTYIKRLKELGLDKFIALYQKAYDRFNKN